MRTTELCRCGHSAPDHRLDESDIYRECFVGGCGCGAWTSDTAIAPPLFTGSLIELEQWLMRQRTEDLAGRTVTVAIAPPGSGGPSPLETGRGAAAESVQPPASSAAAPPS